jgi:hypothetical protein
MNPAIALLCIIMVILTSSASSSIIKSGVLSLQKSYLHSLKTAPLLTNMVTASILSVCSDCVSQSIELSSFRNKVEGTTIVEGPVSVSHQNNNEDNKKKISRGQFSFYRSLCMSVYGAFVLGWFVSQWFQFLNNLIPRDGITIGRVILKVFINQLIMSPFLNSLFFGYVIFTRDFTSTLTQKYTLLNKKLQVDLLPTIARSCVYWSIVHLYNFLILSTKYQLLYTNSAFLLWTTYLSLVGYRSVK